MGGVGPVACQGFLGGGTCICILVLELDLFSPECHEMFSSSFGLSVGLVWLWAAHLLMFRVVFLFCWRISVVS